MGDTAKKFDPKAFVENKGFDPKAFVAKTSETFPTVATPEGAKDVLFRLIDTPAAAVRAGISAGQDPGTLGEKLDRGGKALLDRLRAVPGVTEEAPDFAHIVSKDMQNNRGLPGPLADDVGRHAGPMLDIAGDPLNAMPPLIGEGAQAAKGIAEAVDIGKGLSKMTPEGEFFKIAEQAPKAGFKDRMVTAAFGPGEDAVAAYKANPGLIDKAPGVIGIKTKIDKTVKTIRNKIAEKTDRVAELKSHWDDAYQMKVDELKNQVHPSEHAADVGQALEDLKGEVSRQSGEAFKILDESGITIPSSRLKAQLQMQINEFTATPKITPEGKAAQARLEQIRANMDDLPAELTGSQAKELIQELDAARESSQKAGQYFDKEEQIKRLFRGSIDDRLKKNVKYRNTMAFLADDVKLLNEARDRFGDPRQALTKLGQLAGTNAGPDRELLKRLSHRLGLGIDEGIDSYVGAQKILKNRDLLDQIKNSLPEAAEYASANEDLGLAHDTVERILRKLGPDSSENVVKSMLRNGAGSETAIENAKVIEDLQKLTGVDLSEDFAAEKIKRAFTGGRPHGARSVTMGGDIGEAVGVSAAQVMADDAIKKAGPIGRALGSVYFAYVDKYGGQMARKVIDKELAAKAAGAKVNGMTLPAQALLKNWVAQSPVVAKEFLRPDSPLNTDGEMTVDDPAMLREIRQAIHAASPTEMDSIAKARMLSELNKTGHVKIELTKQPDPTPERRVFGGKEGLDTLMQSLRGGR